MRRWTSVAVVALAGFATAVAVSRCAAANTVRVRYVQVERLARPVINEALLRTHSLMGTFNSVLPNVDLATAADPVRAEVGVVLKALFMGACHASKNALGQTDPAAAGALKPAGVQCAAGFVLSGSAFDTAVASYVAAVAGAFLPDVMRVDTSIDSSAITAYNATPLCGPTLCGGRKLTDPVADITYNYLLNGKLAEADFLPQLKNGATYTGKAGNKRQGHKAVLGTFPYAPAPYTHKNVLNNT